MSMRLGRRPGLVGDRSTTTTFCSTQSNLPGPRIARAVRCVRGSSSTDGRRRRRRVPARASWVRARRARPGRGVSGGCEPYGDAVHRGQVVAHLGERLGVVEPTQPGHERFVADAEAEDEPAAASARRGCCPPASWRRDGGGRCWRSRSRRAAVRSGRRGRRCGRRDRARWCRASRASSSPSSSIRRTMSAASRRARRVVREVPDARGRESVVDRHGSLDRSAGRR